MRHAAYAPGLPPGHLAASAGSRKRPSTAPSPVSLTPAGGLAATRPRQTFEGHRLDIGGGGCARALARRAYQESYFEDDCPSRSGQPSPDGSLKVRKCQDSVGLLSPSRVPEHPYLAHAMAVRPRLLGSAASSTYAQSRGILAQVQVQAAVGAHDTIHTFS